MKNFQCEKHTPDEVTTTGYQLQYAMAQYKKAIEEKYGPNPNIWLTNDETGETIFLADEKTANMIKARFSHAHETRCIKTCNCCGEKFVDPHPNGGCPKCRATDWSEDWEWNDE